MNCPKCGKPVPKYSAFCGSCGASIGRSGTSWGTDEQEEGVREIVREERTSSRKGLLVGLALVAGVAFLFPGLFSMVRSVTSDDGSSVPELPVGSPTEDLQPDQVGGGGDAPALSSGQGAGAEEEVEALVLRYLDRTYEVNLQKEGFYRSLWRHVGSLDVGAGETLGLSIPSYSQVAIQGVCDNECGDLDLVLHSDDGEAVEAEAGTDDFPLLLLKTGREKGHALEVRMGACTAEPCHYAVGVYVR